jgi:general secretion pathway protein K
MPDRSQHDDPNRAGFVLVAAIWLAGILAIALSAFLVHVKVEVRATANSVNNARAEALADGLARIVAYELSAMRAPRISLSGTATRCSVDGHDAIIRIQDQGGLIDLNASSSITLQVLGGILGLSDEAARALADRIADFRDSDDDPRPDGAEKDDYRRAGLSLPPKNAPFQHVSELDQVFGVNEELRERLKPLVTVRSEQDGVDYSAAPAALNGKHQLPSAHSQRQSFAIDVLVKGAGGTIFHRRAGILVLGRVERPFAIVEWVRGSAMDAAALQSSAATKCGFSVLGDEPNH